MGVKLLWTAVTVLIDAAALASPEPIGIVAAVLATIGCILMWLDK